VLVQKQTRISKLILYTYTYYLGDLSRPISVEDRAVKILYLFIYFDFDSAAENWLPRGHDDHDMQISFMHLLLSYSLALRHCKVTSQTSGTC